MMFRILGMSLLLVGIASVASAALGVPEIDPATGVNAIALLGGAALIIRSRRK